MSIVGGDSPRLGKGGSAPAEARSLTVLHGIEPEYECDVLYAAAETIMGAPCK
jgi:hypothetical protein